MHKMEQRRIFLRISPDSGRARVHVNDTGSPLSNATVDPPNAGVTNFDGPAAPRLNCRLRLPSQATLPVLSQNISPNPPLRQTPYPFFAAHNSTNREALNSLIAARPAGFSFNFRSPQALNNPFAAAPTGQPSFNFRFPPTLNNFVPIDTVISSLAPLSLTNPSNRPNPPIDTPTRRNDSGQSNMATLTSKDEPRTAEYAGDEVSAIILDPGYTAVRAGFAGEDTPKSIIPSYYASYDSKKLFGDHVIDVPREDVAINNPYSKDGIVEDWDTMEELWKYSFASKLTGVRANKALQDWLNDPATVPNLQKSIAENEDTERSLEEHPLFLTEPNWNPTKNREKAAELAIEKWGAPAFYTSKTAVLAAFSMGKSSALVIDVGASQLSVTAVHDGMILKKSIMRSNIGGNYLSSQVRNVLASHDPPVNIIPHYLVKSKSPVDSSQPANVVFKQFPEGYRPPHESFRRYQEERTVLEFKETALYAWSGAQPFRGQGEAIARDSYRYPFEFPDGYNQDFSWERFKIIETLFDPLCHTPAPPGSSDAQLFPAPEPNQTLLGLIKMSVSQCDVDLRPMLLSNVVIVGGSSLIKGLPDRINMELTKMYPSAKVRVHAAGMTVERKFGAWIGGSIVASLGTFHQMWISKKEYEEHGAGIIEKRCK